MKKINSKGKYIRPTVITKYNSGDIIFRNSRELDGMLTANLDRTFDRPTLKGNYYAIFPDDVVAALFLNFRNLRSYMGKAPNDKSSNEAKLRWRNGKNAVTGYIRRELHDIFPTGKIFDATPHNGMFKVEYYFKVDGKGNFPDARFVREQIEAIQDALNHHDFDPDDLYAA